MITFTTAIRPVCAVLAAVCFLFAGFNATLTVGRLSLNFGWLGIFFAYVALGMV